MIPQLQNVIEAFKLILDSIKAFVEQLIAIVKGEFEEVE